MGKANNLGDFMTDLADAIREKTGATDAINPQDFSTRILGIKTGGSLQEKDVNLYDYDGELLHSYSSVEFLALESLPPLPTREGMEYIEWNWELEEAKELVLEQERLNIGATCITNDRKTRLYIEIISDYAKEFPLVFKQSVENGIIVDWGDGTVETYTGKTVDTAHSYAAKGAYIITLSPDQGTLTLGGTSSVGVSENYQGRILKAELGDVAQIYALAFRRAYNLTSINLPKGITFYSGEQFSEANSLEALIFPRGLQTIPSKNGYSSKNIRIVSIPNGITTIYDSAFYGTSIEAIIIPNSTTSLDTRVFQGTSLKGRVVIPSSITNMGTYAFYSCNAVTKVILPNTLAKIANYNFSSMSCLKHINIPSAITSIGTNAFENCYSLEELHFPKGLQSIGNNAFKYTYNMRLFDFSQCEAIPTLGGTSVFSNTNANAKMVVPDALYDDWIAATNWSSHASKIIKKSEWDALNA